MLFDSHAHLQEYLDPNGTDGYLKVLYDNRVNGILTVSYDRESSLRAVEMNGRMDPGYATIYRACGIHPEHAGEHIPEELLSDEGHFRSVFSAIGEIGLDYRDGMPSRDIQQACFEEQLKLCMDLKLPAVIHSVKACDDTLRILKKYKGLRYVMHGFSYSPQAADEFVRLGAYIGVGWRLLDEKARRLPETVRDIRADHLLIETDIPFSRQYLKATEKPDLSASFDNVTVRPEPSIDSPDTSAKTHATLLSDITDTISDIKNIPSARIEEITTDNAESFLLNN